jgi:hypothetical protein
VIRPIEITGDERIPEHVEQVLRSLPEWFGIESALLDYVEQARVLPTYAARLDGHMIGICIVKHHTRSMPRRHRSWPWTRRGIVAASVVRS